MAFPWTPMGIIKTSPMHLTGKKKNTQLGAACDEKFYLGKIWDEILENHPRTCMRLIPVVSPLSRATFPLPNGHGKMASWQPLGKTLLSLLNFSWVTASSAVSHVV